MKLLVFLYLPIPTYQFSTVYNTHVANIQYFTFYFQNIICFLSIIWIHNPHTFLFVNIQWLIHYENSVTSIIFLHLPVYFQLLSKYFWI